MSGGMPISFVDSAALNSIALLCSDAIVPGAVQHTDLEGQQAIELRARPWVRIPLSPPVNCSPLYSIVRIDSKNNALRDEGCRG
jgi:hypothetical protein